MMTQFFVSVGSNIEPHKYVVAGIRALREAFGVLRLSPVYQTPAEGFVGDDFLNLVVVCESEQDPQAVAATLSAIEQAHGRVREDARFAARTLDLDLLNYGDAVLDSPGLRLPRNEITKFAFVLMPLADVAGGWVHPVLGKTIAQLWSEFPRKIEPRVVALDWT